MRVLTPISKSKMKEYWSEMENGKLSTHDFAAKVGVTHNVAMGLIERFEIGYGFMTIDELREIARNKTIGMLCESILSMGIRCHKRTLRNILVEHNIKYLKLNDGFNKPIEIPLRESIVDMLKNSELSMRSIANELGVSKSAVINVNRQIRCRKNNSKYYPVGAVTTSVISLLFESANYLTAKEVTEKLKLASKKNFFSAIQHINNNPADYSLSIRKTEKETLYKITAVAEKRKGPAANKKLKEMIAMERSGITPEEIAKAMKYKKETVSKTLAKDKVEGVRKPGEMNPMLAKFLGIKL